MQLALGPGPTKPRSFGGSVGGSDVPSELLNGVEGMTDANTAILRAALAGSGNVGLFFAGDSTTAGGTGTDPSRYNGHVAQVAPLLTDRFSIDNSQPSSIGSAGHQNANQAGHVLYNPIVAFSSGTIQDSESLIGGYAFQHTITTGPMRWTPATQFPGFTFNRVRFAWRESATTQIRWADSTGAFGTLAFGSNTPHVQDIVCGDGATWIEVRCVANGTIRFCGPAAFWTAGTRAILMMNAGFVGSQIGADALLDDWWRTDNVFRAKDFLPLFGQHLTVFNLCINDASAATPVATYKANFKSLIAVAKAVSSVLVMNGNQVDTAVVPLATAVQYRNAAREAALESGVTFWDSASVLGTYAVANAAGDMNDQTHPNVQGQNKIAEALDTGFFAQVQARL